MTAENSRPGRDTGTADEQRGDDAQDKYPAERTYDVALGAKKSTRWTVEAVTLAELLDAARNAPEAADKGRHGALFPGTLAEVPGPREKSNIATRTMLLLDFDTDVPPDWTPEALPWRAIAYETASSTPEAPRYRVAVPFDRPVVHDEWARVTAAVRAKLERAGAPPLDRSSLAWNQYMFMPTRPPGVELRTWDLTDRPPLDEVDVLVAEGERMVPAPTDRRGSSLRDPFGLPGAVGAFNRVYDDLDSLIEVYGLPYVSEGTRWRHEDARSEAGVVELRDGWWYSNHFNKDPAADERPHTAFDLVRIHRFGHLDGDAPAPDWTSNKRMAESHKAMHKLAVADEAVVRESLGDDFDHLADDLDEPPAPQRPLVDVTNPAEARNWLHHEVGRGRLAGMFRRGQTLVHTPQIGEEGYVPPKDEDDDGPAQVQRVRAETLGARIDTRYQVYKVSQREGTIGALFPQDVAGRVAAVADELPNLRPLLGVTHTPVVRRDGTILGGAGYDEASRLLYLPTPGLTVPEVSDEPADVEVELARALLLQMVAEFPFVTVHDRANYLGALLTPLLRDLAPPPYQLFSITAPQRGSGKTLLAWILREVHGGVFRSELPRSEDELRKWISALLDTTSAPVVHIDNVRGTLRSSTLDGMLTSADWSDRRLGVNEQIERRNDRLWVVTGNNVRIGGDLSRRTLWTTINAEMPKPETRTGFRIANLKRWVTERRGELLWALLTLIRAWVAAGRPLGPETRSDDYDVWLRTLNGILHHAGTEGTVGHRDTASEEADDDEEEWATFLNAARRVFGDKPWTARELLSTVGDAGYVDPRSSVLTDELPGDLGERLQRNGRVGGSSVAKPLGEWLRNREGTWVGSPPLSAHRTGTDRTKTALWSVTDAPRTP